MRTIIRASLVAAAAAGLLLASGGPASAVPTHQHCLLTPEGYVPIGAGVTEVADQRGQHDTAFHNLHFKVHTGTAGEQVTIIAVPPGAPCPAVT